jgi:uncharacterized SAM-binding protein YcdF (DUF218 family)
MELILTKVVGATLLPPAVNLLMLLAAWGLWTRRARVARTLLALGLGSLFVLSLPVVSGALRAGLERYPALPPGAPPAAEAIVVLGGGRYREAPEYGGDTVSERSLTRARYAARLQRATGRPLLTSGGSVYGEGLAEAVLLKAVLEEELGVPVTWVEAESRTTHENAVLSSRILRAHGIERVYLVTDASHMTRAVEAFRAEGIEPVAAPTGFAVPGGAPAVFGWIPSAYALDGSSEALHAYLGEIWYRLRWQSGS